MKFFVEYYPNILRRLTGLVSTTKSSMENIERYLLRCHLFPIKRNSVLSGFSFSLFMDINDCKPFSTAAESPDTYSWMLSA